MPRIQRFCPFDHTQGILSQIEGCNNTTRLAGEAGAIGFTERSYAGVEINTLLFATERSNMFDQAKMLWKARQVQKELKNTEIEAQSNDGAVKVIINGEMHLKSIELSENALKPENKKNLERTIQTTVAEAMSRAQAFAADKTKAVMKDMNLNIPGM